MEGEPPVDVVLSDGRTIAFRGKADRVDDDGEGGLVVTDYKTGSGYGYENVAKDPVDRGRKLQLPLYGLAARGRFGAGLDVLSRYWVVSERAGYRVHAVPVNDSVLQRFREVIEVIVDGITSGAFLSRPGEPYWKGGWDNCSFCDFNSLCQEERDVHWTRKKGALSLASYVTMTETDPDRGEGD
jgi:ATP-dependent helicase/DNAse subunit B